VNVYTQIFEAICPNNDARVTYTLRIESPAMIKVEDLQLSVAGLKQGFHEEFADTLFRRFGGAHTMDAIHHGTHIRTVRP
jgi:hypothetical protein